MRLPQRARLDRLSRQAPAGDPPAVFVVTAGAPTAEQAAQIAQAQAAGREVQIVEIAVVVACPACGGPVLEAGGECERCGRSWPAGALTMAEVLAREDGRAVLLDLADKLCAEPEGEDHAGIPKQN